MQLCAQAMCLEEMLRTVVLEAAVYDATAHWREPVEINRAIRAEVERMCLRMHELHRARRTPAAMVKPICRSCSLVEACYASRDAVRPTGGGIHPHHEQKESMRQLLNTLFITTQGRISQP